MGSRPFREAPIQCAAILRVYNDRMMALLTRKPITAPDTPDVLDPPVMTLTPAAQALWKAFHDAVEADLGLGRALHSIRAFGAKMAEHAGRLAATLTVYANPDAMEVDAEAMACGITLAQHYGTEMLRLKGGAAISRNLKSADQLKTWWQARPNPECHLAAIYQMGPGALRDADGARRVVNILEEHGWVRRLPLGTVVDGSPRRDAWVLVP